jgi:hypothetical protein
VERAGQGQAGGRELERWCRDRARTVELVEECLAREHSVVNELDTGKAGCEESRGTADPERQDPPTSPPPDAIRLRFVGCLTDRRGP